MDDWIVDWLHGRAKTEPLTEASDAVIQPTAKRRSNQMRQLLRQSIFQSIKQPISTMLLKTLLCLLA